MKNEKYYIGLDIGTNSVGYAVTDTSPDYKLIKYKGEPMWGVTLFEEAQHSVERRGFRTARRRLDRRQQRIKLLQDIFAKQISKVDERFYTRISESSLLRIDAGDLYTFFCDEGFTDAEYHEKYPTIHHLICDLLRSDEEHDVRLVYIACAWLLAHRGHFLSDVSEDNVDSLLDFSAVYRKLMDFFEEVNGEDYIAPWSLDDDGISKFGEILKSGIGITNKIKALNELLYDGKKPAKTIQTGFIYSIEGIVSLLAGKKYELSKLFGNEAYDELGSIALGDADDIIDGILKELGDDSELIVNLKAVFDWSILADLLGGYKYISEAKVQTYERHKKDLSELKRYVKKYAKNKYNLIFRNVEANNYLAYSGNTKGLSENELSGFKKCNSQEDFCDFIKRTLALKDDSVVNEGKMSRDMYDRIMNKTFMPKQINGDNRTIPYQVYYIELKRILEKALKYLPFINEKDENGYITKERILSVMKFRVPYYVGPLNKHNNEHAWIERKAEGKIYPWNFDQIVDLDKSEQAFIDRMTNTCSYLAGEDVLPKHSFLYEKFEVLNEINNLKINEVPISVEAKQKLFENLFSKRKKVTVKQIKAELCAMNYCTKEEAETISGIDIEGGIKSSLQSRIAFDRLLSSGAISKADAEEIIKCITYSEDKLRIRRWIDSNYPSLLEEDRRYLAGLKFKDFGRLSGELLAGIEGINLKNGEVNTVIGFMWESNDNLSEILLSDKYNFKDMITELNSEYYSAHPKTLNKRLDDMYISNAVKRPIIRTLDIVNDVVKAMGREPEKIFVEMARGADENQKNNRTVSRKQQLIELYKKVKYENIRELSEQLDKKTDNELQSDKLYLYFMQLGKCMYTGEPLNISRIGVDKLYDIDHIYPQAVVKDDSIINNKVLVLSEENGKKSDDYPVPTDIRHNMSSYWKMLKDNGLISDEKYKRLTRSTKFTETELLNFVNRQMVETRQSTKAVTQILEEKYKESRIVYVKAGIVSEFRREYKMLKSRSINDLHHAKDAYLNIVCGNAYTEKFTREWFNRTKFTEDYSIKMKTVLKHNIETKDGCVWNYKTSFDNVKKTMEKNNIHMTFYSVKKKHGQNGGFFDQNPLKKGKGAFPRKENLPIEKYGGYSGITTSFSVFVKYMSGKKEEIELVPVTLLSADKFQNDREDAVKYIKDYLGSKAKNIEIMFNGRPIKIGTVFEFDGLRLLFGSQGSSDSRIGMKVFTPLVLSSEWEQYIKALESFNKKRENNKELQYNQSFDKISAEKNVELYDVLKNKMKAKPYSLRPENQSKKVEEYRDKFTEKAVDEQVTILLNIITQFNRTALADSNVKTISNCRLNPSVSNWKKNYTDVRIIDSSPSGIWEKKSENILDLL